MAESDTSDKTPLISVYNEKPDLRKKEPPLVSLQVTNPVTYLKRWWKRVLGGEGVDFHLKIKPLTAIALVFVIASFGFGIGRITISDKEPYIQYTPPLPTPTPNPWRDTAFSGVLKLSPASRYYLLTASSEAINLEVPDTIELKKLVDKRIFATGKYNSQTHTLSVASAQDLEILPNQITPIPTTAQPSPTPTPTLTPTQEPAVSPTPAPTLISN